MALNSNIIVSIIIVIIIINNNNNNIIGRLLQNSLPFKKIYIIIFVK